MQNWIAFKGFLISISGLDRDALHIVGSMMILVAAALILRKPFSSAWPWLIVLVVAIANEVVTGFADGAFEVGELAQAGRDAALVMALPTLLLILCRFAPGLMVSKREMTHIMVSALPRPLRDSIVDVEFEEVR